MTTNRERLIELAESAYWRERFKQMPDSEIEPWLAADPQLPIGTQFSDAQLLMIAEHRG